MRNNKIVATLLFMLCGLAPLVLGWGWLSGKWQTLLQQDLNDGPYIFYQASQDSQQVEQLLVQWVCQGQLLQQQQQLQQPVLPACGFDKQLQIRPPATALPTVNSAPASWQH